MSEDVSGLPNVEGLEQFVQSSIASDKGSEATPAPATAAPEGQPPAQPAVTPLGQFKTPEDLYKSYQEIQGFTTRVSQENSQLKQTLMQMQEQMELIRLSTPPPQYNQPPAGQQKWEDTFITDPEQAVEVKAERKYQQMRIAEVLDEENMKNPQEFNERYNYVMQASRFYPQLVQSPAGVRKLFEIADKAREQDMHKNAHRAVSMLFGPDVDLNKLKELAKKTPQPQQSGAGNAYMPDTSLSMRSGADFGKAPSMDAQINEAAGKGDVDTVISGVFRNILAKT